MYEFPKLIKLALMSIILAITKLVSKTIASMVSVVSQDRDTDNCKRTLSPFANQRSRILVPCLNDLLSTSVSVIFSVGILVRRRSVTDAALTCHNSI